jgi:hypothetical protein
MPASLISTRSAAESDLAWMGEVPPDSRRLGDGSATVALCAAALGRPRNLAVLLLGIVLFLCAGVAGLPAAAGPLLVVGAFAYCALVARDLGTPELALKVHGPLGAALRPAVAPVEIAPEELRGSYLAIPMAHEELRLALNGSPQVIALARDLYARCGELVDAAGRMARNGNGLAAYLEGQPSTLHELADRLDALALRASDAQAARAFRHAATISHQHVALNREIRGLYDRIRARLAAVKAFLGVAGALVVKLAALDLEQAASAGVPITEAIAELGGELELLEGSLAEDAD